MGDPDFLVIGGGIAGVSIARELARHASVLLVEAERSLAMHTTGRSAAVYLPSYGGPVVRVLTAASRARFAALRDELDTPELLTPRPMLWVGCDDDGARMVAETVAEGTAEPISVDEALGFCPVLRRETLHSAALDADTQDVDAMALHQAYVRGLKARGGRLLTSAPVTELRRDGGGWQVEAGGKSFRAGTVVNAAGAWADELAALAGVPRIGLVPKRRTIAIASGPVPVDPRWPLVADGADRFYFRPEGTRLLTSPADETPSPPTDARPDELDVALALERVNEVTTLGLRSVHTSWAGLRSFVPDGAPVAGAWAEHPGFAFFAGQGGYGIQMAPALAAAGAAVLLGGPMPPDIALAAAALGPDRS